MTTQPMVGCRVPVEWKKRLEAIAHESGRNTAQIVNDAIRQYLETDEKVSLSIKIQEVLQRPETLEANSVIASISHRLEATEAKLSTIQRQLAPFHFSSEATNQGKTMLTSEELAFILGVTSRAVNGAASKGKEHFTQWTKRFKKGGGWTFEIINPGMKKSDRRFIPV